MPSPLPRRRKPSDSSINADILVLFDRNDLSDYFEYRLTPVIQDLATARRFSKEAGKRRTKIRVHVKIDTGMGRIGFSAPTAVSSLLKIASLGGLELEGIMSHFSEADLSDRSYAVEQIRIFNKIKKDIGKHLGRPVMSHMGNSAAVLTLREGLFDAVRPGIMLYGYSPVEESFNLHPVMAVRTRILALRKMPAGSPVSYGRTFVTKRKSTIAVVSIGYADGFNRLFSNNAEMLVSGRRVPVVGRVCMDLTMLDVTGIASVSEGDEVVVLGSQGKETLTAGELASRINTIPYEIVLSLGGRARKEFRD